MSKKEGVLYRCSKFLSPCTKQIHNTYLNFASTIHYLAIFTETTNNSMQ